MRNLKFRGKKIDSNEFVYGSLVNNLWCYAEGHKWAGINVCEIITSGECSDYEEMQSEEFNITVDPNTVGQFAGIKDKNGKDIYEGDILRDNSNLKNPIYIIEWDSELCKYIDIPRDSSNYPANYKFEVIGNIHENPELLNG